MGLVPRPFFISTAQTLDNQPNNTAVRVKRQKLSCVTVTPLGSQIVFKAGGLGNIFKRHHLKSVCSSRKHSPPKQLSLPFTRFSWAARNTKECYSKLQKHEVLDKVLKKWPGHALCLESKKCLKENLKIANDRTFPRYADVLYKF